MLQSKLVFKSIDKNLEKWRFTQQNHLSSWEIFFSFFLVRVVEVIESFQTKKVGGLVEDL